MSTCTVALVGTMDTKGEEYGFVRDLILQTGVDVIVIDAGVLDESRINSDISQDDVALAAGSSIYELRAKGDRSEAVASMGRGAAAILKSLLVEGGLNGVLGLGGSGGSQLFSTAVRDLPIGLPKLLVSTVASGNTRSYAGNTDLTMMYSVVDISGINRLSAQILGNAAAAISGMARAYDAASESAPANKPLIGATMFGVTTAGVTAARKRLEELGYEVLVFHATGAGGDTMESLIESGFITGVLDMTTTELADELVGGNLPAGPQRLRTAAARGLPQVISVGAMDMVNFGPIETVPVQFQNRKLHVHNAAVTLMRTSEEENAELGKRLAERASAATGPTTVFIPTRGVSSLSTKGAAFEDAGADSALFAGVLNTVSPEIDVRSIDADINDPAFAIEMANTLHAHYQMWLARQRGQA